MAVTDGTINHNSRVILENNIAGIFYIKKERVNSSINSANCAKDHVAHKSHGVHSTLIMHGGGVTMGDDMMQIKD